MCSTNAKCLMERIEEHQTDLRIKIMIVSIKHIAFVLLTPCGIALFSVKAQEAVFYASFVNFPT